MTRPALQPHLLINKFGEVKTRQFLQWHYSQKENFWDFAALFNRHLGDKVPDFHRELVELLIEEGKIGVGAPRGFAKSTIVGLIYLAWVSLNGFKHFVPYISDTHLQAKLITSGLRAEIESNPAIQFIYPDAISDKWGEEGFVIHGLKADCFILPLGAGMKIRGLKYNNHRPDLAIIDDLENLEAVYSSEQRQKLQKWFDYDLEPAMDRYSKNIVYIGTILHYNALLKQVLEKKDKYSAWKTRIYKALKDDGTSLWEARFSADYLRAIKSDPTHPDYVGSIVFAQELQNEPQDDQDRIIKLGWLKDYSYRDMWITQVADTDELRQKKWVHTLERVAGVDPAISEKQSADNFSMYVMGFDRLSSKEYMLDLKHGKYPDINAQVKLICDAVVEWEITLLGIETVAYQKGLAQLVRQELNRRGIYTCRLMEIRTDKDKIRRAKIHASAFESGFVYLRRDHPNYATIRKEIEEFPLGANDDAFDSLMLAREVRQRPKARVFEGNALDD